MFSSPYKPSIFLFFIFLLILSITQPPASYASDAHENVDQKNEKNKPGGEKEDKKRKRSPSAPPFSPPPIPSSSTHHSSLAHTQGEENRGVFSASPQKLPETSIAFPAPSSVLPSGIVSIIEIIKKIKEGKIVEANDSIQNLYKAGSLPGEEITKDENYWKKILRDLSKDNPHKRNPAQAEKKLTALIWQEFIKDLLSAVQNKEIDQARDIIQALHKEKLLPNSEITNDQNYWGKILSNLSNGKLDEAQHKLSQLQEKINPPPTSHSSGEKTSGLNPPVMDKTSPKGSEQEKNKEKENLSSSPIIIESLLSSLLGAKNLTNNNEEQNLFIEKIILADILPHAEKRVVLASDQFTYNKLAEELMKIHKKSIFVNIMVGDNPNGQNIESYLLQNHVSLTSIQSGRESGSSGMKMHNKFIVIDDRVILGSPNATFYAYNKNIETLVVIHNQALANLYCNYYNYIIEDATLRENLNLRQTQLKKESDFRQEIEKFNKEHGREALAVCLAPACSIKDFILNALQDATEIKINMFLISVDAAGIINSLIEAFKKGAKIILNIDGNQYDGFLHVQNAIKALKNAELTNRRNSISGSIQLNKIYIDNASFHDKLLLIRRKNGERLVIIGSAGFTKDVYNNNNYENMVLIKNDATFDFFTKHMDECLIYKQTL